MKRNVVLVTLALLLGIVFVAGCAKKTALQEPVLQKERGVAKEQAAMEQEAAEEKAVAAKAAEEKAAAAKAAEERAAAAKAAEERAAAAKAARELYEFRDVNFDFDKFNLREEAREILKKHAEWLGKNKNVMIVVEGHCDERGTTEYNLALGERRASAAARFLVDMGIDARRIQTISYGEELPLDPGHNEEAWAKNRRAHFVVSGKK